MTVVGVCCCYLLDVVSTRDGGSASEGSILVSNSGELVQRDIRLYVDREWRILQCHDCFDVFLCLLIHLVCLACC